LAPGAGCNPTGPALCCVGVCNGAAGIQGSCPV
jgi:hypothetical protein